jgi:hypothetical protein
METGAHLDLRRDGIKGEAVHKLPQVDNPVRPQYGQQRLLVQAQGGLPGEVGVVKLQGVDELDLGF